MQGTRKRSLFVQKRDPKVSRVSAEIPNSNFAHELSSVSQSPRSRFHDAGLFNPLPIELVWKIALDLTTKDAFNLMSCCKSLWQKVQCPTFWQNYNNRYFGYPTVDDRPMDLPAKFYEYYVERIAPVATLSVKKPKRGPKSKKSRKNDDVRSLCSSPPNWSFTLKIVAHMFYSNWGFQDHVPTSTSQALQMVQFAAKNRLYVLARRCLGWLPTSLCETKVPLSTAVADEPMMRMLLENNASPNNPDVAGILPLWAALEHGSDFSVVELLLSVGANPNVGLLSNPQNEQFQLQLPLCVAVAKERVDFVQLLLSYGSDPTVPDRDQRNALFAALDIPSSRPSKQQILGFLLQDARTDVMTPGSDGVPAYVRACRNGDRSSLIQMVESGKLPPDSLFPVVSDDDQKQCSLLYFAVSGQFAELTETLLRAGADPNWAPSGDYDPPLIYACGFGPEDMVRRLIDSGADPNADPFGVGRTPLWAAWETTKRQLRKPILQILLRAGANPNVPFYRNDPKVIPDDPLDSRNTYPILHAVVKRMKRPTSTDWLLDVLLPPNAVVADASLPPNAFVAADVNLCAGKSRRAPLHLAARRNNLKVVSRLIEAGASVNLRDGTGMLPFDFLTEQALPELERILQPSKRNILPQQ